MKTEIHIQDADWASWGERLTALRSEVFVLEQNVPPELEIDGLDSDCQHVVALQENKVIGTGRLLPNGFIGRMCVKNSYRGSGIGGMMLKHLIEAARRLKYPEVLLNAQTQVIEFYAGYGFILDSEPFTEAGILHRRMKMVL